MTSRALLLLVIFIGLKAHPQPETIMQDFAIRFIDVKASEFSFLDEELNDARDVGEDEDEYPFTDKWGNRIRAISETVRRQRENVGVSNDLAPALTELRQVKEIEIRFIGNCGLHLSDGVTNIYIDFPYKSGAHHYMEYDQSEIDNLKENAYFIFTHKHTDHYMKRGMNALVKSKNGKKYGKWNIEELERLSDSIPEFEIKPYKTKHQFSLKHYSYLITWYGKKLYFSGDTEHPETILTMSNLDWAFVPAWLVRDIYQEKRRIDTKMIGVYHIGPRDTINITGDNVVMFKKQGVVISIPID